MPITRLGLDGYGVKRVGSFDGKEAAAEGGPHPVGVITRLSLDGYGAKRIVSFAGKEESVPAPATPAVDTGAGSGRKKRRIPNIRLVDGTLYEPNSWEEFQRLLAAVEYRTGEPPHVPIKKTRPIKVPFTPTELAETYREYLDKYEEPRLSGQRIVEFELRLGVMELEVEEEMALRDRRRRMLLLMS